MPQVFLDQQGVTTLWSRILGEDYTNNRTLLAVINAIDETKQDKIPGKQGQVVGFNKNGNLVAQEAPITGLTKEEADRVYLQLTGGDIDGVVNFLNDASIKGQLRLKGVSENGDILLAVDSESTDEEPILVFLTQHPAKIRNVDTPEQDTDAVNKQYLDKQVSSKQDKITGEQGQVVGFDENGNLVAQAAPVTGMTQAEADRRYLAVAGGIVTGQVYMSAGLTLLNGGTVTGSLTLQSDPISDEDAVNKKYVDNAVAEKQDKIIGTSGQIMSFDEDGNAIAISKEELAVEGPAGASAGFGDPVATVDDSTGIPEVTVTADGPDTAKIFTFNFKHIKGQDGVVGKDGAAGKDGVSPTVTTASVANGTKVTITDATGPHEFTLTNGTNGTNGSNGAAGKDGVSPTVKTSAVSNGTEVTITDASGAHKFTITNGTNGTNGAPGAAGATGPAGPNKVTVDTTTTFSGILKGNGTKIVAATAHTDYVTPNTINGVSFDGSKAITIVDNTKLPLTGGTVTGNVTVQGEITATKAHGAVWNDYAEKRQSEIAEPGRVVVETRAGVMKIADDRLLPGGNIISDTFGYIMGERNGVPIAVAGRVLAYPWEPIEEFEIGTAVCTGPQGTVSMMSRDEIREFPERIIGTVSEIPSYETWGTGNVAVNGRIWIKVR